MTDTEPTPAAPVVALSRSGGRSALVISVVVGIVLAMLVVVLFTREPASERADTTRMVGRVAPAVEGPTIDGGTFSTAGLRGRWVLVNFFASWCVPCIQEHPELQAFDEEHRDLGDAVLVSVTYDNDTDDAREFFDKRGGTWPVIDDPDNAIGVAYGVAQVPETFVIAPNGVVVAWFGGGVTQAGLNEVIGFRPGSDG